MHRPSTALLFPILLLSVIFTSCGEGLSSFAWKSAEGKSFGFSQTLSFPKGKEGIFGAGRTVNAYVLKEARKAVPGIMVAIELDASVDGLSARLALSQDRKPGKSQGRSLSLIHI